MSRFSSQRQNHPRGKFQSNWLKLACSIFHETDKTGSAVTLMVKRLGLLTVLAIIFVFSIEGILTLLRQRNLDVTIYVTDANGNALNVTQASTQTPEPGATPKPASTQLILKPENSLWVRVGWMYHIGPRFPETLINADVFDKDGQVVASNSYKIDCGSASLDCTGDYPLSLDYGVTTGADRQKERKPWAIGEYTVQVSRTYVGFNPAVIKRQTILVTSTSQ